MWWLSIWELSWAMPCSLKEVFFQWEFRGAKPLFKKIWMASFFIITWSIWKGRNAQIFGNSSCLACQIHDLILVRLSWLIRGWGCPSPYSSDEIVRNPECLKWVSKPQLGSVIPRINPSWNWSPSPSLGYKWNIDASLDPIRHQSAIGGVLRNDQGMFLCVFPCPIPPMEINSAEIFAIFRAVKISLSSPLISSHSLIFESDFVNTVKWCNSNHGGPWNLNFMLNFIRNSLHSKLQARIIHKCRESNTVVDALAKQGRVGQGEWISCVDVIGLSKLSVVSCL